MKASQQIEKTGKTNDSSPRQSQSKTVANKTATNNESAVKKTKKNSSKITSAVNPPTANHSRWTFFTNHAHVLILLSQDPSLILREVALRVGITERAVQHIIADLEAEGFIKKEKVGRQNQYYVFPNLSLRHPIEAHRTIGELLNVINTNRP